MMGLGSGDVKIIDTSLVQPEREQMTWAHLMDGEWQIEEYI